jgi:adenylate cyclase, class 2
VEQSGSHIENEIKLRIADGAATDELLRAHGLRLIHPREFEANEVFDTPDGSLRSRGELVRLRTVGAISVLTFKAPEQPGPHKRREELETRVDDPVVIRTILERLGFLLSFRYEKYRSEYQRENEAGRVMLDETPIGLFLELEGAAGWIDDLAQELGFSSEDYILSSYGRLYLDHCAATGVPPTHMTFDH